MTTRDSSTPHRVEAPPFNNGASDAQRVRKKDIRGMPGTRVGLVLRLCQFSFALAALCIMAFGGDFFPFLTFRFILAAVTFQTLWSLSLAVVDIYALLVRRHVQNSSVVRLCTVGDGITSTLTLAAGSAAAGIETFVRNDLGYCSKNNCVWVETGTTMAFISWLTALPSAILNFWWLASQRTAK